MKFIKIDLCDMCNDKPEYFVIDEKEGLFGIGKNTYKQVCKKHRQALLTMENKD